MNTLIIVTLIVLGVVAIALQIKKDERFISFFNLLVFAAVAQLLTSDFDESSSSVIYAIIGLVTINFLASKIKLLQRDYVRALVPLISVGAFLMMFKGTTINFLGEDYLSVNKFLVAGSVIAVLGYELGALKIKVLKKLLDGVEEKDIMTGLLLFFTGVSIFLGSLASSSFGLLVVTAAFLSSSFYRKDQSMRIHISLLIMTLLPHLLSLVEGETAVIVDGDVLEGLFMGAFGMYFIQKLWSSKNRNTIAIAGSYLLVLGVSFGLLWVGTIFYKMGGMDALLGVFVGIAMVNAILGKGYVATSLLMFLLVGASVISPHMVNEEQKAFENKVMITADGGVDEEGNAIEAPNALALSEVVGTHTLLSDSSIVQFELGEGGKTKGAFKKVSGAVIINEDGAKSSLNITLSMKDFTTFVGPRDKSLRSSDYFNIDKFPTIKYKANGFVEKGENVYELNGDFTMLGVTKKVKVSLQRIDLNGRKILIGSGEIDRTLFGMTPDASEGNVVSFNYQVELQN